MVKYVSTGWLRCIETEARRPEDVIFPYFFVSSSELILCNEICQSLLARSDVSVSVVCRARKIQHLHQIFLLAKK